MFHRASENRAPSSPVHDNDVEGSPPPQESSDSSLELSEKQRARQQQNGGFRRFFTPTIVAEFCSLVSLVFLILVFIGNTYSDQPALTRMYFLKIDVSNIVPTSFPNAALVNTLAQSLGLRDFYQVGLWNYCEGYKGPRGVTYCSTPKNMYWFNPVPILLSQLLAGATIALPSQITDALDIAKVASHWMLACYYVGLVFTVITLAIGWIKKDSKPLTILVGTISFIAALFLTIATVVSTVLWVVFRSVFESAPEFNIRANIGPEMFAFMWISAIMSLFAFGLHAFRCCCCCCCCRNRNRRQKERQH